ncbi:MAG: RdgB/HAM1 family non-canonical purine NTP pyrophosphatase [Gammaproteobacteria bacterium]|jgi:XTP/dITP diphosphohydrolase
MSERIQGPVVLATANPGKVRELAELLAPSGIEVVAQSEFDVEPAEETGLSFVENALLKARHAASATGLAAIADDSGLAVDALGGEPGIYSARYAGVNGDDSANIDRLLRELDGLPEKDRTARFHCAMVFVRRAEDPVPIIAQGAWEGRILTAPRGDGGFGYDPVFWDPELGRSAAELTPEEKHARSHRGQALRALLEQLAG